MRISDADLAHLERLARLRIPDAERDAVRDDLARVLDAFATLSEVDTEGLDPLVRPVHLENVLRDDEVRPSLAPDTALACGASARDGFFEVPRTVDGD